MFQSPIPFQILTAPLFQYLLYFVCTETNTVYTPTIQLLRSTKTNWSLQRRITRLSIDYEDTTTQGSHGLLLTMRIQRLKDRTACYWLWGYNDSRITRLAIDYENTTTQGSHGLLLTMKITRLAIDYEDHTAFYWLCRGYIASI